MGIRSAFIIRVNPYTFDEVFRSLYEAGITSINTDLRKEGIMTGWHEAQHDGETRALLIRLVPICARIRIVAEYGRCPDEDEFVSIAE